MTLETLGRMGAAAAGDWRFCVAPMMDWTEKTDAARVTEEAYASDVQTKRPRLAWPLAYECEDAAGGLGRRAFKQLLTVHLYSL
jgi:hypothetical protein